MKRQHQGKEDAMGEDEEDAEMMNVQDEEKVADDDEQQKQHDDDAGGEEVPFLDTFYGLSSADPVERAQAGHACLFHCLVGPDANTPDAAYALKRLLNALCSGRAAARQGNASALTAFLRIAVTEQQQDEESTLQAIQEHVQNNNDAQDEMLLSDLSYVRKRLLDATDPGSGADGGNTKRKGSEERDYKFGRLFGIVAVIKSGILVPGSSSSGTSLDEITATVEGFGADLVELYQYKKWMREPAAHAICLLLNSLYNAVPSNREDALAVLEALVTKVIAPQLLSGSSADSDDDDDDDDDNVLLTSYTAEQLAVAIFLQAHIECHPTGLPALLRNTPVLSVESIPKIAAALSETSIVTQPRCHLVWDVIWEFLTLQRQEDSSNQQSSLTNRAVMIRTVRSSIPVGDDSDEATSPEDIIRTLLQSVVVERLLGMENVGDENTDTAKGKTTHERRALALCIVRNLTGVEFVSSITGRMKLEMGPEIVETGALEPVLVQRLFIDVIGAKKKGGQGGGGHTLKPLATQILTSLVDEAISVDGTSSDGKGDRAAGGEMRLAVLRALLRCDPRFDARTKGHAVHSLLESNMEKLGESFWKESLSFLEAQILRTAPSADDSSASSHRASGYVDLMFNIGKRLTRRGTDESNMDPSAAGDISRHILDFCMASAFFDCRDIKDSTETPWKESSSKKQKKRKSKEGRDAGALPPIVRVALDIKSGRSEIASSLPYEVRTVASARFFSLLSELVLAASHSTAVDKETTILGLLTDVRKNCGVLESAGAKRLGSLEVEAMDTDEKSPEEVVEALHKIAEAGSASESDDPQESATKRFGGGLAVLSSTIFLHLLSCGQPEAAVEDDDPDADDEEDKEEVTSILSDLYEISEETGKSEDLDEDFLLGLAELCANILSSPLSSGNQSRGASPTLLREAVKMVWTRALSLASTYDDPGLSSGTLSVILNSAGMAVDEDEDENANNDESKEDEDMMDEDDDDDKGEDEVGETFAKAAALSDEDSDKDEADEGESSSSKSDTKEGGDDNDVELDPSKLQSLLEEEIEDDSVEEEALEHHEGADAALAKLIELKQEARKAGQKARERQELARQVRCTLLLDTLLSGRPEGWGKLLRVDTLLQIGIALLRYRSVLEKALARATERGADGTGEKRAMLDRITAMLKGKLLKTKVGSMGWSGNLDASDFRSNMSASLYTEARMAGSKEQRVFCSNAILLLIRATSKAEDKLKITQVYENAVEEWASKRTSRFESAFFDHLIQTAPAIAQICLPRPLATAASTARSTFLKSEAFRLLAQLYNPKLSATDPNLEEFASSKILESTNSVLESIALDLKDDGMKKAKRAKEVLKAAEKVVSFLAVTPNSSQMSSLDRERINEVKGCLVALRDGTESQPVSHTCDRIIKEIEELGGGREEKGHDDKGEEQEEEAGDEADTQAESKKSSGTDEADDARTDNKKAHKKKKKAKSKKKKRR